MKKILVAATLLMILAMVALLFYQKDESMTAQSPNTVTLPIIMYHSLLKDKTRSGEYIVTPDTLKADLDYLKANGYTTVFISDIVAYLYDGVVLPDKPVVLTFDDGNYNNYVYLYPILKEMNMKAVISVVGEYSQRYSETGEKNANYGYLAWAEIEELAESGYVEIANHSFGLHSLYPRKGASKKYGESDQAYKNVFDADTLKAQQILKDECGVIPIVYTYPFGCITQVSREYLKELGFLASLSCAEKLNKVTDNPDCLFELGRFNRPSGVDTESFMKKRGI